MTYFLRVSELTAVLEKPFSPCQSCLYNSVPQGLNLNCFVQGTSTLISRDYGCLQGKDYGRRIYEEN